MATSTAAVVAANSTDAQFRTWGKLISDTLTSFGIVKTPDTGQIDWTTVIKPATAGTMVGYEIRAFTDAMQTTKPVIFKIEYGASTNSANAPTIQFSFGSSSNGVGTVTHTASNTNVSNLICGIHSGSSIVSDCFFSGSSNRLTMTLFRGSSTPAGTTCYIAIERTKNSIGQDTSEGLLISRYTFIGGVQFLTNNYFPFIGSIPPATTNLNSGIYTPSASTGIDSLTTNIYPNVFWRNGTALLGLNTQGYFITDISTGFNTFNVLGSNHTYYFVSHSSANNVANGNLANTSYAMLFE